MFQSLLHKTNLLQESHRIQDGVQKVSGDAKLNTNNHQAFDSNPPKI
jgi:hypothetical protein